MTEAKNALVTGGSHGIGRGIVKMLAEGGWNVFFSYHVRLEAAEALKKEVEETYGVRIAFAQASMHEPGAADQLLREAADTLGGLSLVVNNAGRTIFEPIQDMTDEAMDELIDLDLKGYLRMARCAANHMKERGIRGAIVNITSTRAQRAYPGDAVYGAVKAGVERAAKSMALDLAPYGIRVNCVAPGATRVRDNAEFYDYLGPKIPLERVGEPEDIGRAVRFLASEEASYITGQVLPVDGGLTLPGMPETKKAAEANGWGKALRRL